MYMCVYIYIGLMTHSHHSSLVTHSHHSWLITHSYVKWLILTHKSWLIHIIHDPWLIHMWHDSSCLSSWCMTHPLTSYVVHSVCVIFVLYDSMRVRRQTLCVYVDTNVTHTNKSLQHMTHSYFVCVSFVCAVICLYVCHLCLRTHIESYNTYITQKERVMAHTRLSHGIQMSHGTQMIQSWYT